MFTYADMEREYAEHGIELVWLDENGEQWSADPADYWYLSATAELAGDLAVHVPATLRVLPSAAHEPRRSRKGEPC